MVRTVVTLAIVATLVLAAALLFDQPGGTPPEQELDHQLAPSAILTEATTSQFSDTGNLEYRLTVTRAEQYLGQVDDQPLENDQGFTKLWQPELTIYSAESGDWVIRAQSGLSENDGREITLTGNVVAERSIPGLGIQRLSTEEIVVEPQQRRARSSAPITLEAPGGRASATGMNIDINTGITELQSNVRGTYDAPK